MTKKNEHNEDNNTGSVDQIRDILFGEQIKIIEKRFVKLEENINKTISNLADNVEKGNLKLQANMDKSHEHLHNNIADLSHQQSEDLKNLESTLSNKIIETESDLINQIQSGLQKLDHKASHRNDLAQLLKELADKLSD